MAKGKTGGAHTLRKELLGLNASLHDAQARLSRAIAASLELGATDQLAIAVRALRGIANARETDNRSRGLAKAALTKMGVEL